MAFSHDSPMHSTIRMGQRLLFGVLLFSGACATIVDIQEPILVEEQNATGGSSPTTASSNDSSSTASTGGGGGMGTGGAGGSSSKLMNGAPCATDSDCESDFCVDGVCCNEECSGECKSCSEMLKGSGNDGECGLTAAGTDPADECNMGVCDGAGYCFSTPYDPTKYYKLVNEGAGKTADVGGTSSCDWKCDGQDVLQWVDYNGARQHWQIQLVEAGVYKIINEHSGKAIEVEGASGVDGAIVQQWTYTGGAHQRWRLIDVGSGYFKFENVKSGKVMQVAGNNPNDGANLVQMGSVAGALFQKWIIIEVH